MKCLILVAHGSRRPAAREEVMRITAALTRRAHGRFDLVKCAFLQFGEPTCAESINACAARGANQIVIAPFLLTPGRHIDEDIPALVAAGQKQHPGIIFRVAPHLAIAEGMADLILSLADPG